MIDSGRGRQHRKVVEKAPSPLVERTPSVRERLFGAARAAASAINRTGAGTVGFLADDSVEFFLLEMKTRPQVEHRVTECSTVLDLVALQLDVATDGVLPPQPPGGGRTRHRGSPRPARAAFGDSVAEGQPVLWLEGVVTELPVTARQQVDVGTVLAIVTTEE